MKVRVLKSMSLAIALTIAAVAPITLVAQSSTPATVSPSPSRWDIFLGYSYIAPFGTVQTPVGSGSLPTTGANYTPVNYGAIGSLSYYFTNHFGMQVEGDAHPQTIPACTQYPFPNVPQCDLANTPTANSFYSFGVGPIYRWAYWHGTRFTPFIHATGNMEEVTGPLQQPETWGWSVTGGGGLDWEPGWFHNHLALRLIQADYQYMDVNYGDYDGGSVDINALRLSAGLVFHIGSLAPPPPVTLACSVNPTWVYPGDPATVTATAGNVNPKENLAYSWSGSGVTGNGPTATVATGSLAPGSYDVKAHVVEGRGDKSYEVADCTASLMVKGYEPPTISCSANPSTIKPGDTSTITAEAASPQNRPLTYTYSTETGTVTGDGATATYNSTGAAVGAATINCNVADDKGGTATATTTVTIQAPYVAPAPHTQALCSITFEKDPKRPMRVDNDAKACLDEVALDLQKQTDATAVVVGDATAAEKAPKRHVKHEDFAAQRAVNAKDYLVTEKGIDPSRIIVKTGSEDAQEVQNYLVPSGADFATDIPGTTTPVNESVVKPQSRKAAPARHEHKKAVAK